MYWQSNKCKGCCWASEDRLLSADPEQKGFTAGVSGEMQQHDIIMLANHRLQCQSNLHPENTRVRKANEYDYAE